MSATATSYYSFDLTYLYYSQEGSSVRPSGQLSRIGKAKVASSHFVLFVYHIFCTLEKARSAIVFGLSQGGSIKDLHFYYKSECDHSFKGGAKSNRQGLFRVWQGLQY